MASTTPNMALHVFDSLSDLFNHNQLASNFTALDGHDHTLTKGVQIPTAGLVNGAVTSAKIAANAGITRSQLFGGGNLVVNAPAGNVSAADGNIYFMNGGQTCTLPAPAANAVVGVIAKTNVNGTSQLTIAGTNIQGVGLTAAASFVLGTASACIILESDGSSWTIISGQQDTGWVALTLQNGWQVPFGVYTPAYRLKGNEVELSGGLTAAFSPSSTTFATLPTVVRPAQTVGYRCASASSGATEAVVTIASSGVAATNGTNVSPALDVVRYRLS